MPTIKYLIINLFYKKTLTTNTIHITNLFSNETLRRELNDTLLFLCEVIPISNAFIAIEDNGSCLFYSKVGLECLSNPYEIKCFKGFVADKQILMISDIAMKVPFPSIKSRKSNIYNFFAGFPIKILNEFKGSICFLSKDFCDFTNNELKIIKQSVANIESFLKLHQERQEILDLKNYERQKFEVFENNSKEILFEINSEGVITYVSKNWTTNFGHEENEAIGKNYSSFIHAEDFDKFKNYLNTIAVNKTNKSEISYRLVHPNGNYIWNSTSLQLIKGKGGRMPHYIGNSVNITGFEETKQKIKLQKDFYETILDNIPTDVVVFDLNHKYIYVNPIAIKNEELRKFIIGKDDFEYARHLQRDPSFAISRREKFLSALQKEKTSFWEETLNNKNEGLTYHNRKFAPVFNEDGSFKMMIGFSVNITESKRKENKIKLLTEENNRNKSIQLNEARHLYRLLAENTIDLVCLHNIDGTFQYISPSVHKLLGYNPEDLMGKSPSQFVHPEDLKTLQESIPNIRIKKKEIVTQLRFKNSDGIYIWFETKAELFLVNEIPDSIHSVSREITAQKKAEESIKKSLKKEQKLNELRTNLVATISHEFRTPMTTIRTSAELMTIYLDNIDTTNHDRLKKRVTIITEEIDRIVDLMNTVLIISKEDAGKTDFTPIHFDLKQVCENIIRNNYSNQKDGRIVQFFVQGETFTIFADQNLMEYTLFNILDNAFKYSAGFGNVIFNIFASEKSIKLEIIDYGIGIPKADQHKLFNSFFRASNTTGIKGTGLGLSIVKTFTEKNSGTIKIKSSIGMGTKVMLEFPIKKSKSKDAVNL